MSFKAKVSIDVNGVKEERSVYLYRLFYLAELKIILIKGLHNLILTVILSCLIHQIELMAKLLFR